MVQTESVKEDIAVLLYISYGNDRTPKIYVQPDASPLLYNWVPHQTRPYILAGLSSQRTMRRLQIMAAMAGPPATIQVKILAGRSVIVCAMAVHQTQTVHMVRRSDGYRVWSFPNIRSYGCLLYTSPSPRD